jgi:hypothetical protein
MAGLDFSPLIQSINTLIKMLADFLVMIHIPIAAIGLTITAVIKRIMKDSIEGIWLPIIAIVLCGSLSLIHKFNCDIVTGITTGCIITGGYALVIDLIKKIIEQIFKFKNGTNGNGNGKEPAPVDPKLEVK